MTTPSDVEAARDALIGALNLLSGGAQVGGASNAVDFIEALARAVVAEALDDQDGKMLRDILQATGLRKEELAAQLHLAPDARRSGPATTDINTLPAGDDGAAPRKDAASEPSGSGVRGSPLPAGTSHALWSAFIEYADACVERRATHDMVSTIDREIAALAEAACEAGQRSMRDSIVKASALLVADGFTPETMFPVIPYADVRRSQGANP
jgi:hypothetical protein